MLKSRVHRAARIVQQSPAEYGENVKRSTVKCCRCTYDRHVALELTVGTMKLALSNCHKVNNGMHTTAREIIDKAISVATETAITGLVLCNIVLERYRGRPVHAVCNINLRA